MPTAPNRQPGRRAEPAEIIELRRLRHDQPELAAAVDLQIAVAGLQARVKSRLPVAWIDANPDWLKRQHVAGRPLFRLDDLRIEWTDARLLVRQTADLLLRFDLLEHETHARIQALARQGPPLEVLVAAWFSEKAAPDLAQTMSWPDGLDRDAADQVLTLAIRPFLERCAEMAQQRTDLSTWTRPYCPLCGGDPELAVITRAADRLLICGRCGARWAIDSQACPWCRNAVAEELTTLVSHDRLYGLVACERCRRYLKAFDARSASRPVMPMVDTIATLPLDAAAAQRGYVP
jgi:FdhE protein